MDIKPENLEVSGYQLIDKVGIYDLKPFLVQHMQHKNPYTILYNLFTFISFGLLGYFVTKGIMSDIFPWYHIIFHLILGFIITLLLIPVHEFIHVLAYKSQGAKETSYDANWKKFYFMALANKFVANRKEFTVIAMAPFVIITSGLIISLFFTNLMWVTVLSTTLLVHTVSCGGDFSLMSYLQFHKGKDIATFDDVPNKVSYFYGKITE